MKKIDEKLGELLGEEDNKKNSAKTKPGEKEKK
jgi:hypothetical protein